MNVYDSQRMADALAPAGFAETAQPDDADLIILNTCHIREKAAEKVYSELGRLRVLKQEAAHDGREVTIAVAGCVAQAEGEEIIRRAPAVDLVVGRRTITACRTCSRAPSAASASSIPNFPAEDKFAALPAPRREATRARGVSAFVTVQEGCDKFCTFCVVPYTRGVGNLAPGRSRSSPRSSGWRDGRRARSHADRAERQRLSRRRARTAATGRSAVCCIALAEIPGIARLRYTTSHPRDMEDDLIAAHRDLPALMPYLHLPVQSGSDRILAAMNRRHTRADYLAADRAAARGARRPRLLVGLHRRLPGRDRGRFPRHARAGRRGRLCGRLSRSSIRRAPARPPPTWTDQVPEDVKIRAAARLQAAINRQSAAFNAQLASAARFDVLLEKPGRTPANWSAARHICSRCR